MGQAKGNGPPRRWADAQNKRIYRIMRVIALFFFRHYVRRYRAVHVENVPRSGGAFLIANHSSGMDPVILGAPISHRVMSGPGKIELFANPVATWILRTIGIFPLRQGQADAAAVRTMVELYRAGRVVIVYPEGGRSDSGEMTPFNPDFARLMLKLQAPVIPAGIYGARDLLPVGGWIPRPNTPVVVVYGEPVDLTPFYGRHPTPEQIEGASELLSQCVKALVEVARCEAQGLR